MEHSFSALHERFTRGISSYWQDTTDEAGALPPRDTPGRTSAIAVPPTRQGRGPHQGDDLSQPLCVPLSLTPYSAKGFLRFTYAIPCPEPSFFLVTKGTKISLRTWWYTESRVLSTREGHLQGVMF